jgi:hypothetical protein
MFEPCFSLCICSECVLAGWVELGRFGFPDSSGMYRGRFCEQASLTHALFFFIGLGAGGLGGGEDGLG